MCVHNSSMYYDISEFRWRFFFAAVGPSRSRWNEDVDRLFSLTSLHSPRLIFLRLWHSFGPSHPFYLSSFPLQMWTCILFPCSFCVDFPQQLLEPSQRLNLFPLLCLLSVFCWWILRLCDVEEDIFEILRWRRTSEKEVARLQREYSIWKSTSCSLSPRDSFS